MVRKTLSKDWATFTEGDFSLVNNPWNKGDLTNGRDYTQSITFNTNDPTQNVKMTWDWPDDLGTVVAYPEIIVGFKPWGQTGTDTLVTRLDLLQKLHVDVDYGIRGDRASFNVAFDLWLSDKPTAGPNQITTELMIWTHDGDLTPAGKQVGNYRDGDFRAEIWVADDFGDSSGTSNATWRYIAIRSKDEIRNDTIDIDGILKMLIRRDLVDGSDFLNGYEFGAEVTGGRGNLLLHSIDHEFSARQPRAAAMESDHAASVTAADDFYF